MAPLCRKCQRVNPAEAAFCYFDGTPLDGAGAAPMAVGSRPFTHPLHLASGRCCRSFDELALALEDDWPAALEFLRRGYLEAFLVGLGRADLAQAARGAARFPDPDRGLDQFLTKLPTTVLQPPKLYVHPQEVNLGVLPIGGQRRLALRLENQGMRLLYGAVTCEGTPWLAVGEPPGALEKLFHFRDNVLVPVLVSGQRLRASTQPLEGRLVVTSNGGNVTVVVRATVPVKPFPDGVLAGATSPRQLAKQARSAPKAAAALFQSGGVAAWYRANGWSYPIQGQAASGLGAVQQFFEALGLVEPPAVEISTESVNFLGFPGDRLDYVLQVRTREKRPVYAHAASDRPWLMPGTVRLLGQVASIPLRIPSIPDRPGETLFARVTVTANGGQRFVVGVGLAVLSTSPQDAGGPRLEVVEVEPTDGQGAEPLLEALPVPLEEETRTRPRGKPHRNPGRPGRHSS